MRVTSATLRGAAASVFLSMLMFILPGSAVAQTETVLYNFCPLGQGCADGANPYSTLIMDKKGNLYGTTFNGGTSDFGSNFGTVFKLSPGKGGVWTETVLYPFCQDQNCADGSNPHAGVTMDKEGNLYGTTEYDACCSNSGGIVFELSAAGVESVLHTFAGCYTDGQNPDAGVVIDKDGNLWGTTSNGGPYCGLYSGGTIYEKTPTGYSTFFSFSGSDGANPVAGVIDEKGSLYGTTYYGGCCGDAGLVFKVGPTGSEDILWKFTGDPDGSNPTGGVVKDKAGNIFGTTLYGGSQNEGAVYEITPSGSETVLYSFCSQPNCTDGENPYAGLIIDGEGNLYGTTVNGGEYGEGTAFKITPTGQEAWVYSFQSGAGTNPYAGLLMDKKGNLYGTTVSGGAHAKGTVFKITP
jgi:uncharacterized repeat protein (TIGR03803 family)